MTTIFVLRRHNNSDELHIFEADSTSTGCTAKATSRCGRVPRSDTNSINSPCYIPSGMRHACAPLGAEVCGVCVGTLYAPFDGEE